MQPRRLQSDRRIFFPWEGSGRLRRYFAMGRLAPILVLILAAGFLMWVGARERAAAGERRTRVSLNQVRPAVERYFLESEGSCPESVQDIVPFLPQGVWPKDAWGRPLRLVCPSVRPGKIYVLMSDGPDGKLGGLDRIEY